MTELNEADVMIENFLLIGGLVTFAVLVLHFLKRGSMRRNVVEPDKLTAELQHLGDSRKYKQGQEDATASQNPRPPAPDKTYQIDANLADIESGDAFREFAREEYRSGPYPMPSDQQVDRIAAEIDEIAKKKSEYVQTLPIAIVRGIQLADDTKNGKTSWFGGRPMLGTASWPRTSKGVPMHHWASINLPDLCGFETPPGLPELGRLVFFVNVIDPPYEAKAMYINGGETPTAPPDDLPIIDHESKFAYGLADYTKEDAPIEHPLWTVEFVPLPMDGSKESDAVAREILADRAIRLPDSNTWHQMFGEGVSRQVAREEHPYDHMLLQLEAGDMMMGAGYGGAVVQFWISPNDLLHQNWDAVTVTMESD
jgi:uncharacterized protein YwqG